MKRIAAFLLTLFLLAGSAGCAADHAVDDVMEAENEGDIEYYTTDCKAYAPAQSADLRLGFDLLSRVVAENKDTNVLVSPLSVKMALAMAANGADGETLSEFEEVLGASIDDVNSSLFNSLQLMENNQFFKLSIANSLWYRDQGFLLSKDFADVLQDSYKADVASAAFDSGTVRDINKWVSDKTDGMIDDIIDSISGDTVMMLINALAFDAEWSGRYDDQSIEDEHFTSRDGKERIVSMMHSVEHTYIECSGATGFIKPYKGSMFSFAALLPDEGIDICDFVTGLSSGEVEAALNDKEMCAVTVGLPKFSYDFDTELSKILSDLGMPTAFAESKADFSRLGEAVGNIFVSNVLHKTHISVDQEGTKAAAATAVAMADSYSAYVDGAIQKEVILDRPFVYMILDNETNMPLFIGVVTDIKN